MQRKRTVTSKISRGLLSSGLALLLLSGCLHGGALPGPELRLEGIRASGLPEGALFSPEAKQETFLDQRLARELQGWIRTFGPGAGDAEAGTVRLSLHAELESDESRGVSFLRKEYLLEVDIGLFEEPGGERLGRISGTVQKRMSRFVLDRKNSDAVFDRFDEEFLRYAAAKIAALLYP
jgi:hypothetical protein